MPLVKTVFNQRIVKTKRVGDAVWVMLERSAANKPRQWITIPEVEYGSMVRCQFVPREGTSRDDAE